MTCIVGFEFNNSVWIGADSAGVSNDFVSTRLDKKVFVNKNYVFGFTGSFRMGQLLRFRFDPPIWNQAIDLEKFMVVDFVDAVRDTFRIGGENEKTCCGFLVGCYGKLFEVDTDYQIAISTMPFASVGSGKEPALGSLFTTYEMDIPVEDKLIIALRAAQNFCSAVREPFYIDRIDK